MSTLREYLDANRPAWRDDTDADLLTWLLADVTVYVDIEWRELEKWMMRHGLGETIDNLVSSGATPAIKTAARHVRNCIAAGQPLYTSDAEIRSLISAALPAGAARTDLIAMATSSAPRYASAGVDWAQPWTASEEPRALVDIARARAE